MDSDHRASEATHGASFPVATVLKKGTLTTRNK